MKKIQLGGHRGRPVRGYALVDDEDFDWLAEYRWTIGSAGYAVRCAKKSENLPMQQVLLHRQVMGCILSDLEVDHKNRNRLDCQRENLRVVTKRMNSHNVTPRNEFRGVRWDKERRLWRAEVKCNGKIHWGGRFQSAELAARVAKDMRLSLLEGALQ